MIVYHGSPELFDKFDLSKVGESTGIKYGIGVNTAEAEATAVHYSQPRHQPLTKDHYLYTVEIPDLTDDNHLISARPVNPAIVQRTEAKLGKSVPKEETEFGRLFRKWVGRTLTGAKKSGFVEEKAAAQFLDSIGVVCNLWPRDQQNFDSPKNYVVFNPDRVRILKVEHIDIMKKDKKNVLVSKDSRKVVWEFNGE